MNCIIAEGGCFFITSVPNGWGKDSMTKPINRRSWKNYVVRSDVQLPILAANLLFLIAAAVVLSLILLSPLYHDLQFAEDPWVRHVSGHLLLILLGRIALAMLLILGLATLHQIIMGHRFCGPLVNFGHTFSRMAKGDFTRKVFLRKKDFLHGEALLVNEIIDRLNADGRLLKTHLDQVTKAAEALMEARSDGETKKHLQQILQSAGICRAALDGWTICTAEPCAESTGASASIPN
jgi:hypothetical protein